MSSIGWAGLGTKLHLKLYEKWTSGLNKYERAASEGQRSLRLWPYVTLGPACSAVSKTRRGITSESSEACGGMTQK